MLENNLSYNSQNQEPYPDRSSYNDLESNIQTDIQPDIQPDIDISNDELSSSTDSLNDNVCIICLEDDDTHKLYSNKSYIHISKCNCKFYVHDHCFRQWIDVRFNGSKYIKCLVCNSKLRLKNTYRDQIKDLCILFSFRCFCYSFVCIIIVYTLINEPY